MSNRLRGLANTTLAAIVALTLGSQGCAHRHDTPGPIFPEKVGDFVPRPRGKDEVVAKFYQSLLGTIDTTEWDRVYDPMTGRDLPDDRGLPTDPTAYQIKLREATADERGYDLEVWISPERDIRKYIITETHCDDSAGPSTSSCTKWEIVDMGSNGVCGTSFGHDDHFKVDGEDFQMFGDRQRAELHRLIGEVDSFLKPPNDVKYFSD
jgi:hypothetical protein